MSEEEIEALKREVERLSVEVEYQQRQIDYISEALHSRLGVLWPFGAGAKEQ